MNQRGSRRGLREIEGEEDATGWGAAGVCVLEEGVAARSRSACGSGGAEFGGPLVLIKDVESFYRAHFEYRHRNSMWRGGEVASVGGGPEL
jgi:hypothetical protein